LINHLGASQSQLNEARQSLQEAKDALGNKRADLVQLWSRGQTLEEMMRILDQMYVYFMRLVVVQVLSLKSEHLKSVPDVLETLISEKRLLQASILLIRSLKTINGHDMAEIGAVADLRSYLNGQETVRFSVIENNKA
jgi:exocyst complex component 4